MQWVWKVLSIIFLLSIDYKICKIGCYPHLEPTSPVHQLQIQHGSKKRKKKAEYQRCHFYSFQTNKILVNRLQWLLFWWLTYYNSVINRISWSICNIISLTVLVYPLPKLWQLLTHAMISWPDPPQGILTFSLDFNNLKKNNLSASQSPLACGRN